MKNPLARDLIPSSLYLIQGRTSDFWDIGSRFQETQSRRMKYSTLQFESYHRGSKKFSF